MEDLDWLYLVIQGTLAVSTVIFVLKMKKREASIQNHLKMLKSSVKDWNEWRKTNEHDGVKVSLVGANLSNTDISHANLVNVNLSLANLSNANLKAVNLKETFLNDADLSEANLTEAEVIGAYFTSCNLTRANLSNSNFFSTKFYNANLKSANFKKSQLGYANFSGANLSEADFSQADLFEAKFNQANLENSDFTEAKLIRTNLSGLDFSTTKLEKVDFSGSDLSGLNLSGLNLSKTNLSKIQALNTTFKNTILTGACIEDWNINSDTNFDNVICDYIYLKQNKQERRPSDPNRNFEPGEFAKLVQKSVETVDLIFNNGIDWKVFLSSYKDIQVEYGEQNISIQAIEQKSDGAFVIRLSVLPNVDKANTEESFWQIYKPMLQAKDEQIALYGQVLEDKNQELEDKQKELVEKRLNNSKLINIVEGMAKEDELLNEVQIKILQAINQGNSYDREISESLSLSIHQTRYYLEYFEENRFITAIKGSDQLGYEAYMTCELTNKGYVAAENQKNLIKESNMSNNEYNFNAPVGSVGNKGTQTNITGLNQGTQIGTQYNSPQEKTLAEAADEIQKLLEQLEQTNPTATEEDKIEHINDETTPKFKRKVVAALKAAGNTAIDEFLDNSYVKVGKAAIMGWVES